MKFSKKLNFNTHKAGEGRISIENIRLQGKLNTTNLNNSSKLNTTMPVTEKETANDSIDNLNNTQTVKNSSIVNSLIYKSAFNSGRHDFNKFHDSIQNI